MNVLEYSRYLKSDRWKRTRLRKLLKDGRWRTNGNYVKCDGCDEFVYAGTVEIHHKHYRTIDNEILSDLAIYCPDCHAREHGKPESTDLSATSAAELMEEVMRDLLIRELKTREQAPA